MNFKRVLATVMTTVMVSAMAISTAAAGETDVKDAAAQEVQETKAEADGTAAVSEGTEADDAKEVKSENSQSTSDKASEAKSENADAAPETKTEDSAKEKTEGTDTTVKEAAESDKTSKEVAADEAGNADGEAKTQDASGKTAEQTGTEKAVSDEHEAMLALQNDPNHAHKFEWIAVMNEFEAADGTNMYMCPECGKVWFFSPMPAYLAFSGSTAHKIKTAPQGDTVKITTSHFISFNKEVMEALKERPDVSLYVSFLDQEYKGNRVSFTIPAGADAMSLLDENGYAGFLYIGGKFGLTMEVPMATDDAEAAVADQVKSEQPVEEAQPEVKQTEEVTQTEAATQQKEEGANAVTESPVAEANQQTIASESVSNS